MTDARSRSLRWAWICLALTFVGFIVGMVLAEFLVAGLGYDETDSGAIPAAVKTLAGLTSILVLGVPAVLTIVFGVRARRAGRPVGVVPVIISSLVLAYVIVLYVLGAVLGTLGG
jgi:fatty acid desaturase